MPRRSRSADGWRSSASRRWSSGRRASRPSRRNWRVRHVACSAVATRGRCPGWSMGAQCRQEPLRWRSGAPHTRSVRLRCSGRERELYNSERKGGRQDCCRIFLRGVPRGARSDSGHSRRRSRPANQSQRLHRGCDFYLSRTGRLCISRREVGKRPNANDHFGCARQSRSPEQCRGVRSALNVVACTQCGLLCGQVNTSALQAHLKTLPTADVGKWLRSAHDTPS